MAPDNIPKNQPEQPWWLPVLPTALTAVSWIIAPVAIAVILGKFLDERYQTASRYTLICLGVAFFLTLIGLGNEMRRFQKHQAKKSTKPHETDQHQS